MKSYPWIFLSAGLLAVALAPGACGSSNNGGSGGSGTTTGGAGGTTTTTTTTTSTSTGGTGGSTTTTSSSSSSSSSSSTGTGGAPACADEVGNDTCGDCLVGACCSQVEACSADTDCVDCFSGASDPSTCSGNQAYADIEDCQTMNCNVSCGGIVACNPVTSAECTGSGDACDVTSNAYTCLPADGVALCGDCDENAGPFCGPTMTCLPTGKCARFCCDDGDCGTGVCDMSMLPGGVGVCVTQTDDAGTPDAACDAPATAPSGGKCYTP